MARRMEEVQSPIIPIIGELTRRYPGTISLGQGVVYYGPPPQAIAAIQDFLSHPQNHKYQLVQGIPTLVEGLQEKLRRENGIVIGGGHADPAQVNRLCVTAGGNMAFVNAVLAITDPGDEIILLPPCYFNHEMAVRMCDCLPVLVPVDERFQPAPEKIRQAITPKTRAVVTVSPNNPTGAVYPEAALREINRLCREHGIYHIHDEAYEYFTYGATPHFSPGSIADAAGHTISLFSFSKAYGFASWRIGYMVFPAHLEVSIKKIQDTILICPPVISQYAAAGALQAGAVYCREKRREIEAVRALLLEELGRLGNLGGVVETEGAFYFLLHLDTERDDLELAMRLVEEHGVAVIPGKAFNIAQGRYLRLSYGALQQESAAEGIRRLVKGLQALLGG